MADKPELKQFGELLPADFDRQPVWVGVHTADYDEPWYEETDEEPSGRGPARCRCIPTVAYFWCEPPSRPRTEIAIPAS